MRADGVPPERQDDQARERASSEALYGISLELLADLLREWRDLWSAARTEMESLPSEMKEKLLLLPSDPHVGLKSAVSWFARSFHPEVVEFLLSNLEAGAALVDHLAQEEREGTIRFTGDGSGLEERLHRLESLIGGVGAVLRTLGEGTADQERPD